VAYSVEFSTAAARELRKLPRQVQASINPAIDALADNPRPHGVEKISGEENAYRIRIGDYRVLYEIYDRRLVVIIIRVAHRREAYR